eukprot:6471177-Amphidinium_carterae.3
MRKPRAVVGRAVNSCCHHDIDNVSACPPGWTESHERERKFQEEKRFKRRVDAIESMELDPSDLSTEELQAVVEAYEKRQDTNKRYRATAARKVEAEASHHPHLKGAKAHSLQKRA